MEVQNANKLPVQSIDYLKVLKILWSRWYWIAACIFISLSIAYVFLWYTPKVYSTSASLKFVEEKSEITELLAVKNIYDRTNKVQTETYVIQSRDVLLNAISRLNYRVSYFVKGRVRTSELYPEIPFPIEIISQDSINFYRGLFDIKTVSHKQFELSYSIGEKEINKDYNYGETIDLLGTKFKVLSGPANTGSVYSIKFNSKEDFLGRVIGSLTMREAAKSSNVLMLTVTDRNPVFAADILNAILKEYVYFDGYRRSMSASQTIAFINQQLQFLSGQVKTAGTALANFKSSTRILNLSSAAATSTGEVLSKNDQKKQLELEELTIKQLEDRIKNNLNSSEYNFNVEGKVDAMLAGLVERLNSFFLEKERKLAIFTPNSDQIKAIDKQIDDIKKAIITNIQNYKDRNSRLQRYVAKEISEAERDVTSLPATERNYINLQADFDINQKVFSYLFEKKLEAQISKAAVVPGATIVEEATPGRRLISPLPGKIYTYAFLWGIGVGAGLILLIRIINPYIYDKETVESLTSIPIIGVIREFPGFIDNDNTQALSVQKPKSIFAESVRSVRTNLSFLAGEKKSKVICITSEISGEGKSFVSINLASTLALIDKKVVLVAADLRKSKLHKSFNTDNQKGLSTYLSKQHDLDSVVVKTSNENLDFIPSGPVPPNPSELLHTQQLRDLIARLSEIYDFVLLDTAPVGLVSDSIPLIRHADINLFVIRSGVSRLNAATIPDRLSGEYKLNNVVIVLNAVTDDAFHTRYYSSNYTGGTYQYYYSDYSGYSGDGYYSDDPKPKWWNIYKRLKG
ncbi:GumC family protein [Paradesertivirga mongoliensis]|uniref:non-specific protein-tyrosine kinase n=1 Tax=Paradesertivirga mongoliensis TaxID=2100740 RepID=A0ABW4ZHN2_9SPHI|nr:tyrosine-protein kinase [Pedobacter mongoliensis]